MRREMRWKIHKVHWIESIGIPQTTQITRNDRNICLYKIISKERMHRMSLRRSSELLNKKIMRCGKWKCVFTVVYISLLTISGRRCSCAAWEDNQYASLDIAEMRLNVQDERHSSRPALWQAYCRILSECSSKPSQPRKEKFYGQSPQR